MKLRNLLLTTVGGICLLFNATHNVKITHAEESGGITDEKDGVKISLQTDKESYLLGEKIQVAVLFSNTSNHDIKINHDRWTVNPLGIVSQTYQEGDCQMPGEGLSAYSRSAVIEIPMGKTTQLKFWHKAKEPGNPMLIANFYSSSDSPPTEERKALTLPRGYDFGNWFGQILATKRIEVKNEIHPEVLKTINEAEASFLDPGDDSMDRYVRRTAAIRKLQKIGYPAQKTLIKLLRSQEAKVGDYYCSIVKVLVEMSGEAFDEQLYKELVNIARDTAQEQWDRLAAMGIWETDWQRGQKVKPETVLMIPDDFKIWSFQQLGILKDDKNKEIKEKANDLLYFNKKTLEKLGLGNLLPQ
ncbi:MAG: hypothetical protein WC980_10665 [Candidatus Brocadiia bacterium]